VLITGLGYIGSALAARLLAEGEEVVGLESFFSTPRAAIRELQRSGLRLIEGSIRDPKIVESAFAGPRIERVIHLAGQASALADAAPLAYTMDTNFVGPTVLLDVCLLRGVRHVTFASSMRLYRTPLPPVLDETSPVEPPDLVHLSQLAGEMLLVAHRAQSSAPFRAAALRMGIVYGVGPVMKTDLRFLAAPQRFCLQAARKEPLMVASAELAFVHLDDVVEALCRCVELPGPYTVANVASEVLSIIEVAQLVQAAAAQRGLGVTVRYQKSAAPPGGHVVGSRLAEVGFAPQHRLAARIGDVLDHYLAVG
jgi:nucleoside-diphosphate-sugar epimerase